MKCVITGATGFVGRGLCARFVQEGHAVVALTRNAEKAAMLLGPQVTCLAWGDRASEAWKQAVGEADTVIHLAGESVGAQKWTPEFKAKIRASRVETTRVLVEAISQAGHKPGALISASAVGYYGDRQDETLTEESAPGHDFLAEVVKAWEAEAIRAEQVGVRVARLRLGVVLGEGGALERMLHPLPGLSPWALGLGGPMGSGRQWFPWVHHADTLGMFHWAATNPQVSGAVNVVAPTPVTNADFAHTLGRVLHRPAVFPLPGFVLRALLGEFAETLLGGQKVLPTVAEKLGYVFQYPDLERALESILKKSHSS